MRRRAPPDARDSALRALSRREHSAAELKGKLTRRGVSEEDAGAAVTRLADSGLQSDARYAEVLVRSRIAQGYGPLRIEAELDEAQVPAEEREAAFAEAQPDWRALAIALHVRKFKQPPAGAAEWQKQYRFLAARGFTSDQIRAALKGEPPE